MPEWLKGTDCKSVGFAYAGSNPAPSTILTPARSRNFGPDAKPQRGGAAAKAKKKESERPRGPIPLKSTGRSFTLDDDTSDDVTPDIDDFATSRPYLDDSDDEKS